MALDAGSEIPTGLCQCGCGKRTRLSPYNDAPRGYVKGQPRPFVLGHKRALKPVRYIVKDCGYKTPCWVWQLALMDNGYGQYPNRGGAHKVYYEERFGAVPVGAHLDHLCRNRACVNPEHMEPVTCAENVRRGANAKLTYDDVEEVKRRRTLGETQQSIADLFGVRRQTIGDIERGRTWVAAGGVVS